MVAKAGKQEDKKILSAVKKYSPQPLDGLAEANLFKDDNTVIHFVKPAGNRTNGHTNSAISCKGELYSDLRSRRNQGYPLLLTA